MDWETLLAFIFVWGLAILAGISLAVAIWSLRWPSVKGVIAVSFVEQTPSDSTSDSSGRVSETHQLAYSYTVRGDRFWGANLKPLGGGGGTVSRGEGSNSSDIVWSGARDAARWYRPGAIVDVYYCPQRPAWSCLEPGGFLMALILGGLAIVFNFALLR